MDTNLLVYAHDLTETKKRPVAQATLEELWRTASGVLSIQVLQEFYATAIRKYSPPMSPAEAREVLAVYADWPLVRPDAGLILAASELHERQSVSFWDALIVEAAQRAGASRLLTEDLQHGRTFGALTVENPFADASG
ncbi:PIN domain-containing protein [Actinopolymorpha sp. B11F2]|uniref:PIN domain-containing protein n=1 Tax=Actinopolymorpha sp. B11F2 TaxID=3160862 RepID=UPI0032E49C45